MGRPVKKIKVRIPNKDYDILVGHSILNNISIKKNILSGDRFVVIVSSRVYELYEDYIKSSFQGYSNYDIMLMDDGEDNKNYRYAEDFFNSILQNRCTRNSVIIGIGGGVVGDFSGFLAALFMRGIPVIHVPTTLLAMVDSSIGGKAAVNISAGKNIVGAFHQPEMVISDMFFLETLPDNELKNGLSELLKHAIIGESEILDLLSENDLRSLMEPDKIARIVYLSAKFKASVVERDETEGGLRAILNYGHTIGHAIESFMEYRDISHGEAVAVGMKIETEISRRMGLLTIEDSIKINEIIDKYNLIYNEYKFDTEEVIRHMKYDKKNVGGGIKFVLLNGIGNPVYNQQVDEKIIRDIL